MSFAQPIAWILFLLAIPIILFYILKIRLRQEPVSTTIFWQQVFEERRSRSFWRQLRHLISLLLSLIFLSLLAFAVLNPIPWGQKKPARCVIVVDNSASMNARTGNLDGSSFGNSTRLEQAKSELNRLLNSTDVARQTALLSAGGRPQIIVGFTDHLGTLRRGLDSIAQTDSPTALAETIELAQQLIASEKDSSILVYSDGCIRNLAELEQLPNVRFFPVGKPTDNIAITRFQPRRSLGDAVGYEILVETQNFGSESVEVRLEVELGNRVIDVVPLTLEPNKPWTTIIRDTTAEGGLLLGTLKMIKPAGDGALPMDNIARAFLPARPMQQVFLCGENDFFLEKVLQSQPNIELRRLAEVPVIIPEGAVLILHQTVPETLPEGNIFIVDPRNSCDLFNIGEPLESPIIAKQDKDSSLLKFVHLTNLMIHGARKITSSFSSAEEDATGLNASLTVLAETPEAAPVYLNWQTNGGEVLLLSADLKRGDLALRTAFPIMISQALLRFRGSGGELEKAYSTDETVRVDVKTTVEQILLKSPAGKTQLYPVERTSPLFGTVSFGKLSHCGVWEILEPVDDRNALLDAKPKTLMRIACNLFDADESNLRLAPESFYEQQPDIAALRTGVRPIWFWLALIALLFTTLEWFLYQRRWTD